MKSLLYALFMHQSWSPVGLDERLLPIAAIESSSGANVRHKVSPISLEWTAFGALGLKPVVAYESYKRSRAAQSRYTFNSKGEFYHRLFSDVRFYNYICNIHMQNIIAEGADIASMVFEWRYGKTAARNVSIEHKINDQYVVRYFDLAQK